MKKRNYLVVKTISVLTMIILLAGCRTKTEEASVADTPADIPDAGRMVQEEKPKDIKNTETADKESLAKRMEGKYSFDPEDSDPDKRLIMNVISFGNNLYAYCGEAMRDDSDTLEAYSYWAAEFIPYDTDDMSGTDSKSVKVNELCFSNMSNAGKYWSRGWNGTITLTEKGLLFEGFDKNGFLCGEDGESRLFASDDKVEDIFAYVNSQGQSNNDIQGMWAAEGDGADIFLDILGSNMTVFKKSPSSEVIYSKFGCDFDNGSFTGRGNILGYGKMPCEITGEYSINGDRLSLTVDGDAFIDEFAETVVFSRINEDAIPVIIMDDIIFSEDSFGSYAEQEDDVLFESSDYYGVFIAAFKNRDDCLDTEMKLEEAGYHLCPVVYTPDFSKLNPDPYYVVSEGLYTNEKDALKALEDIKAAGFKDAYVKETGPYIGDRNWYILNGDEDIEILKDCVILHNVSVSIPYMTGDYKKCDLYVYESADFDSSAELEFFGNYEAGDTPYKWIVKNYNLKSSDPDKYIENGPALSGIFEVSLDGNRIERYYASYWWD